MKHCYLITQCHCTNIIHQILRVMLPTNINFDGVHAFSLSVTDHHLFSAHGKPYIRKSTKSYRIQWWSTYRPTITL